MLGHPLLQEGGDVYHRRFAFVNQVLVAVVAVHNGIALMELVFELHATGNWYIRGLRPADAIAVACGVDETSGQDEENGYER